MEFDDLGPEPSSIPLSLEYYLFYISPATYDGILIGYYNALFPGSVNISLIDESVYCKGDGRIGVWEDEEDDYEGNDGYILFLLPSIFFP